MSLPSLLSCLIKSSEAVISPAMFDPAIEPVLSKTKAISSAVSEGKYVAASVYTSIIGRPNIPMIVVGFLIVVSRLNSLPATTLTLKRLKVSLPFSSKFISKAALASFSRSAFFVSPDLAAAITAISVAL